MLALLQRCCTVVVYRRYYTPSILQLAGLDNQAALLFSLIPAATNALGTLLGMRCIDRHGRRRLLLCSIAAVVLALAALGSAFLAAERHSPAVTPGGGGGGAAECPVPGLADCTACLRAGCGFCGGGFGGSMAPGTCLAPPEAGGGEAACPPPARLSLHGCPSRYTPLVLACLIAYLAAFSPGLGPVPWAVNAEIYPLPVRGLATGERSGRLEGDRQGCRRAQRKQAVLPHQQQRLPACGSLAGRARRRRRLAGWRR